MPVPSSLDQTESDRAEPTRRKIFLREPWENAASVVIALGVFMLVQPFSAWLYNKSFVFLLIGTIGFLVVSHFDEA